MRSPRRVVQGLHSRLARQVEEIAVVHAGLQNIVHSHAVRICGFQLPLRSPDTFVLSSASTRGAQNVRLVNHLARTSFHLSALLTDSTARRRGQSTSRRTAQNKRNTTG